MIRTLLCWMWVLLGTVYTLAAQDPHYIHYSSHNGLPSSEVYDIAVDSNGVVWMCTDRGVCRYNGYEFETFTTREGLSNNTPLELYVGPNGVIWFLGLDGSISWTEGGEMAPFPGNNGLKELVGPDKLITRILWDPDGGIFLFHRDENTPYCVRISRNGQHLEALNFQELAHTWQSGRVHDYNYLALGGDFVPKQKPTEFLVINRLDAYYARYPDRHVLIRGQLDQADFRQETALPGVIHDLYADHLGDLWVPTSKGLFRFPSGDLSREPDWYFKGIALSSIVEDQAHSFWVTTLNRGVFYIPSLDFRSANLSDFVAESPTVTRMVAGPHHLVFSTMAGDIFSIDTLNQPRLLHRDPTLFAQFRWSTNDPLGPHIFRFQIEDAPEGVQVREHLENSYQAIALPLENGMVLNAGYSGYFLVDPSTAQRLSSVEKEKSLRVVSAAQSGGTIYLGTLNGILVIENYDLAGARRLLPDEPLLQTRINDIEVDAQGRLWLGTIGNGVLMVEEENVHRVDYGSDTYGNMVNNITLDDQHRVWIAANEGIFWVEYTLEPEFRPLAGGNIDFQDGIPSNFIRDIAWWRGQVWIGTDHGMTHFFPKTIQRRAATFPRVMIDYVRVNRQEQSRQTHYQLEPEENNIALRFTGVSHHKPNQKEFYRFRMLGLDSTWSYSNDRSAQFINLRAGDYTFEVSARAKNGTWNPNSTQIHFSIQAPLASNFTFAILIGVALVLAFGLLILFRARRQSQKDDTT